MSRALLAAFPAADALLATARRLREDGGGALDAFTPYPVEGLAEALALKPSPAPWVMLAGGVAVAAALYALEVYSAVFAYPFDSGGRPRNSWPAFLLAPVELGVFAAALTGVLYFLFRCGLPRLNHPLFDLTAFERASQDRFLLAAALPVDSNGRAALRRTLAEAGALWIEEVEL